MLDVKDGQVRLISEVPTTSTITLSGYNGYNNAVKLIDDTCSTLYNNSKFASKVQNLKIEDIQDKMVESNYNNIDTNYGKTFTPTYKYYPSIIEKEKAKKVNGTEGIELDVSEQKELINQEEKSEASSLEVKYTQWRKTMTTNDFKDSKYYELFIKTDINASSGTIYTIFPTFRNEEVLLNRAEAYVMLEDYEKALADLNIFCRQRTGFYSFYDGFFVYWLWAEC